MAFVLHKANVKIDVLPAKKKVDFILTKGSRNDKKSCTQPKEKINTHTNIFIQISI